MGRGRSRPAKHLLLALRPGLLRYPRRPLLLRPLRTSRSASQQNSKADKKLKLPTIISALGGYTPNEVQLWSVIPYAVAAVCTVIVAIVSDRMKLRGVIMLFTLPLAIIGYAVIANTSVKHPKVKYGMTFLMATGMYASVPCVLGWNSNNSAGHYKRATTSALQLIIANSGGFVASKLPQAPSFQR